MATLFSIFFHVILPVFVVVAIGYVAGRALLFDLKTLSRFGLYVLVPCLTFTAMARTTISAAEFGRILLFYVLSIPPLWGISIVAARALKLDRASSASFHISVLFNNCVNVGFPVLALAYGQAAVERGIVYMVAMHIALQTLGIYIAARGRTSVTEAARRVLSLPGVYALGLGILVRAAGIPIPAAVFDPLKLAGDSLLPYLLIVLGMQLARTNLRGQAKAAATATVLRLGMAAVLSVGLAELVGLEGIARNAVILENSTPSAIFGVALAHEFDAAPDLITTIIFVSTLASMLSLTLLVAFV